MPKSNLDIAGLEATITSINLRKENHGDERVLACDVKLALDIDKELADTLLGGMRLSDSYWNEAGVPKLHGVVVKSPVEFDEHKVVFSSCIGNHHVATMIGNVNKVMIEPQVGHAAECVMRVQAEVEKEVVANLSEYIKNDLAVAISPMTEAMSYGDSGSNETGGGSGSADGADGGADGSLV